MKAQTDLYFLEVIFMYFQRKLKGIDHFMGYSEENLEALHALWFQSYIKLFEQCHDFVQSALFLRGLWPIQSWVGKAWNFLLIFCIFKLSSPWRQKLFSIHWFFWAFKHFSHEPQKSPSVPFWDNFLAGLSCLNPSLLTPVDIYRPAKLSAILSLLRFKNYISVVIA